MKKPRLIDIPEVRKEQGKPIRSRVSSKLYRENYDKIFNKESNDNVNNGERNN